EVACGILLIVPAAANWMRVLTPLAAGVLTVEALGLSGLYARRSLKVTAANPLVWSVAMTLMAGFVAFSRERHGRRLGNGDRWHTLCHVAPTEVIAIAIGWRLL